MLRVNNGAARLMKKAAGKTFFTPSFISLLPDSPLSPHITPRMSAPIDEKRQDVETNATDEQIQTSAHDDFPDGGLRAWLVVTGVRISSFFVFTVIFTTNRQCATLSRRKHPQVVVICSFHVHKLIFLFLGSDTLIRGVYVDVARYI